ncbi:MAG: pyridoxamine 5'-phosphate oxidase [Robiginitomaculum sp.]|nr:pyridoxamine 5'-phosphate oxidase [Robiginitomaculum sp.]
MKKTKSDNIAAGDKKYHDVADDEPLDLFGRENPFTLFGDWLELAKKRELNDANAMTLASVDDQGLPDARMVLLKGFDETGFVFYTNLGSAKAKQLAGNQNAALVFHWKSIRRQVRVRGFVEPVSDAEADVYFASRAKDSKIGAHASKQSEPLESRFALEKRIAVNAAKFAMGKIPRPANWSGFRIVPIQIEFWRDRPFRLHDRLQFVRKDVKSNWSIQRLYP